MICWMCCVGAYAWTRKQLALALALALDLLLLLPRDFRVDANAPHRRLNAGAVMGVARQDAEPAAIGPRMARRGGPP